MNTYCTKYRTSSLSPSSLSPSSHSDSLCTQRCMGSHTTARSSSVYCKRSSTVSHGALARCLEPPNLRSSEHVGHSPQRRRRRKRHKSRLHPVLVRRVSSSRATAAASLAAATLCRHAHLSARVRCAPAGEMYCSVRIVPHGDLCRIVCARDPRGVTSTRSLTLPYSKSGWCSGELGADGGSTDGVSIDCNGCHEKHCGSVAGDGMAGGIGVAGEAVAVASAVFFAARRAFSDASLHSRKLMPSGCCCLRFIS